MRVDLVLQLVPHIDWQLSETVISRDDAVHLARHRCSVDVTIE